MPVDEDEFKRIIRNMLQAPPRKHADSKTGKPKSSRTIIPPKKEDRVEKSKP